MRRVLLPVMGLVATAMATAMLIACGASGGSPEDYPERPINVTVGWSAGGSSDLPNRALAREMEEESGGAVQVTNVEGATGGVAANQVAQAEPDGYNVFAGASVLGTYLVLDQAQVGWEDYYPFLFSQTPTTIYVQEDSPYETLEDLVDDLEENPGSLQFGTPGPGSNGEILARILFDIAGLPEDVAEHVPYGGGSEAGQFLVSGEVDFISVTLSDTIDFARSGEIRPLGNLIEGDQEIEGVEFPSLLNDYPDLEDYTAINPWYVMYLPRETEPEIVERFSEIFLAATASEEFRRTIEEDFASVYAPTVGQEADEIMSQVGSARSWPLYEFGVAPNSPEEFGIPRIEEWSWPPNERAQEAEPWPEGVQASVN